MKTLQDTIDDLFGVIVAWITPILFFDFGIGVPFIIILLVTGGIFFTFRFGFVNLRLFRHGIDCVRGKFDNPDDPGEISHFRALTSALSATVGLGNIAGVAVAIAAGGPGAIFWMWLVAFFGMSLKFSSCSLAQMYRQIGPDGHVLGGPMVYLRDGIREQRPELAWLGSFLGILFAVLTLLASFGAGNMFQGKMSFEITRSVVPVLDTIPGAAWIVGLTFAVLVGAVILGGIRRIGEVTGRMVPTMCAFYLTICLVIILVNVDRVPALFLDIFRQAFAPEAASGGFLGVLVQGTRRAAFSNEAGLGSAAIAHAAARTDEPIREGSVAMLGPFIDTIVVCTMTALAILITGVHDPGTQMSWAEGAILTARAFGTLHASAQYLLVVVVLVFAYSTMISWSYYGERATEFLFGRAGILPYRIVYVFFVALGPVLRVDDVLDFSDIMLLSMAFPNVIGMLFLARHVRAETDAYVARI
ncbi:MAG: amino acid carrier protein [Candidatus Binatia bacterium]|nr:amino acid carrier protein [Candidatus Binatia bacterium]